MSASGGKPGVLSRMAEWWRGLVETISPDLARCEYECRELECSTERFDACDNRKEYAAKNAASTQERRAGTALTELERLSSRRPADRAGPALDTDARPAGGAL